MGKILTVVVPTYNAEKYLRDNLESFKIPELMEDLEILIVNDGSTDHSLGIAEEYVRQYPDTYRVITKRKRRTWLRDQLRDRKCAGNIFQSGRCR